MYKNICICCKLKNIIRTEYYAFFQGADFKNNKTTKQLNKFIWTNRKQVKFCFYLPIGLNKFV